MATIMTELPLPKGWSRAYIAQIATYINARDSSRDSGWYYGNREQFEKRHRLIKEWAENMVVEAYEEGVKFE